MTAGPENDVPTGAALRARQVSHAALVADLAEKMKLRQWCVEKACETAATLDDVKAMTVFFYNFVTTSPRRRP